MAGKRVRLPQVLKFTPELGGLEQGGMEYWGCLHILSLSLSLSFSLSLSLSVLPTGYLRAHNAHVPTYTSQQRMPHRRCIPFYDLASDTVRSKFCHSLLVKAVSKVQRGSREGNPDLPSGWRNVKCPLPEEHEGWDRHWCCHL